MFTIDYLGQSSIFCEFDSYFMLCFVFFCRAVKAQEGENFLTTRVLPEYFPLVSLRSIQSVALSVFHVCFRMVLPWKRSGVPRSFNGMADLLRRLIDENDSPVTPYVFRVVKAKWVFARILTVSHPIIERSASAFCPLVCFSSL